MLDEPYILNVFSLRIEFHSRMFVILQGGLDVILLFDAVTSDKGNGTGWVIYIAVICFAIDAHGFDVLWFDLWMGSFCPLDYYVYQLG